MRRLAWMLVAALAGLVLTAGHASAQFEVANRAFHNGTAFPLQGRHLAVECESCHLNKVYRGTPTTCFQCHWLRRQDDRYETRLGSACEQCHTSTAWSAVRWDHGAQTGMPLNPSHRTLGCDGCHKGRDFRAAALTCVTCHQTDYARTQSPNHAAAGFPTSCETCHRPSDATFTQAIFDHNASFPLTGAHATQSCASCHRNNVYQGTSRDCVGCHQANYDRTTAPSHVAAGFPTTCETCHRPTDTTWRNGGTGGFNHNAVFQLVGTHATTTCATCHKNNVYKGTPRDCVGCHQANYDRTTAPSHVAAGFPTTCETCHRPTDTTWRNGGTGGFNHNAVFQLVGTHATTTCATCHKNNVYKGTPRDCVGCHQANYDRTTAPSHVAAGFPTSCETCHRPTDTTWRNGGTGGFNHNAVFQLVGTHATTTCATCHKNNVYKGTPRDCVGCHQANYDRTTAPSHVAAGFPTSCETCHRPTDTTWRNGGTGGFNHNAVFQLVGTHATTTCATCHKNNVYKGTPRDCVGCHRALYDRTSTPPHGPAGFSTTCDTCHRPTDTTWRGATFNHATAFALVGRHAAAACTSCHVNNVYKGTPRDCVGCHRTLYDATRNPNHVAAGFPTGCDSCHRPTDTAWTQGRFTHRFPLSGPHNRPCAECHTTPNNFQTFSCTVCHGRSETDSDHRGENGYRYDSVACYSCHPNGRH